MTAKLITDESVIEKGREILIQESMAITAVADRLGNEFAQAVKIILTCKGRVVTPVWEKVGLSHVK